jgi:hypothetical protein
MAFQLRERNIATLEEMQNVAVDVEDNMLNKKAKLEALRKNKTKKEHVRSSEVKLDILTKTINEMMHTINKKHKFVVQISHVPLVPKMKNLNVSKHFAAQPWYHGLDNDCFMYSIHNIFKDEIPTLLAEEPLTDMMCMFDDFPFMDDLPKYDEDYIQMDFPKKSTTYCWEEDDQLQFKQENQSVHRNHDNKDKNAGSVRVSVQILPLCFSSFQFLRENYEKVVNSEEEKPSNEIVKDVIDDKEAILDLELESPSSPDFQAPDESFEPKEKSESMECNSVPLVFDSFQILKEILEQRLKGIYLESQEISCESMKHS